MNHHLTVEEVCLATAFREYTLASRTCAVCGYQGVFLEAHHVLSASLLRREGFPAEVVYDPRNGLPACSENAPNRCHSKHTNWVHRIPRSVLPPEVFEFAEDVGLTWRLDRDYPLEEQAA